MKEKSPVKTRLHEKMYCSSGTIGEDVLRDEIIVFVRFSIFVRRMRGAPIRVHNVLRERHSLRHVSLHSLSPYVQACTPMHPHVLSCRVMYFHVLSCPLMNLPSTNTKIDDLSALTPSPRPTLK